MFTGTINIVLKQIENQLIEKELLLKNLQNFTVSSVTGYSCNGDLIGFQPKRYTYIVPNYQYVFKIKLKLVNSISDDISVLKVNNIVSIQGPLLANNPNRTTTEGTFDFTMDSSTLLIEVGSYNTEPNWCSFSGGFEITLYYK